jgi:hypothetical protein
LSQLTRQKNKPKKPRAIYIWQFQILEDMNYVCTVLIRTIYAGHTDRARQSGKKNFFVWFVFLPRSP